MKLDKFIEFIELSLNNSCNLQCQGCPSLSQGHKNARELDMDKVIPVVSKFNPRQVFICGNDGEPLEHSRFPQIIETISSSFESSQVLVATNGELLEEVLSQTTAELSNVIFQVAVDGPNQEIHELTRVGGSLEKVLRGIEYIKSRGFKYEVVMSRHLNNESYVDEVYELIKNSFGVELILRDTTILTSNIKPPTLKSISGNVSFLYTKNITTKTKPWFKRIYINSNGDCYPCVSFIYKKTDVSPVVIYNYTDTIRFLSDFITNAKSFCSAYQSCGDLTQCKLNCDTYVNEYEYDTIETIKDLA